MGSSMVSIPYIYHISSFRPFDINSPIDLTCTESEMRRITGDKLLNMPGMLIPYCIPFQLHFKILQYLQHPCAAIITKYKKSLIAWIRYWDLHFATVFGSFEPW